MRQCNTNDDDEDEDAWIKRVKSEGSIPLLDLDKCCNGWASPPGNSFMVRGPQFFSTKNKIAGGDNYLLKPLGFDWIKSSTKVSQLLNNPRHRVWKAIRDELPETRNNKPFVWAFNLQLPSKENYSLVAYFVSLQPVPQASLMDQFLKGDDDFRNSRLKLITHIVKGPWVVKKAAGEQSICIIGRVLTCNYFLGKNFMEVDIDVGSSMVASAIVHLGLGYWSTLAVDVAFVIEGQTESELPERVLGAFRFSELQLSSARPPIDDDDGNDDKVVVVGSERCMSGLQLQPSLSTRLWRSVSRRTGNQECASGGTNGVMHREKTIENVKGC